MPKGCDVVGKECDIFGNQKMKINCMKLNILNYEKDLTER